MDRRTTFGLRVDVDTALHEFQSLLHVVEAKASAGLYYFEVKAHAAITDRETNLLRRSVQLHIDAAYSAMLHRIVQGFL